MKWSIGITGGTGYIGYSVARYFGEAYTVRLLDVKEPKQCLADSTTFQYCDVRNFDEVRRAVDGLDLVIHTSIIQIPLITEQKKLGYDVNFLGTQNVCRAVEESSSIRGLILSSSWHTIGERGLTGIIDEEFGFRPDKVENRARLYALSKIAQESIVRFYDEMSRKIFGIIRMGTVLGEGMPEKTAANIFIENSLSGKPLTPFKHSMFRPMLYVGLDDICRAYKLFAQKILKNQIEKEKSSMSNVFNVYHPKPVTIFELAEITRCLVAELSEGKIQPKINIVDTGQASMFSETDKDLIRIDVTKALRFLGVQNLKSPKESIKSLIENRLNK